ncbi:ubiquitin-like protein Pup [Micrococcus terreus]|uniref:Prokaryotic ubiquitin-like protein Pup n=1 Tax=Micrococcus terreus TaxID=574650 RepID=A0A1I7MLS0_9MICC|nr:ubiquitin-like protein Pup [Micrococcus terreus]MDK7699920.1 ubiquitin-like protein Pup [Micrococcus terreus]WOO98310.1 ubiquitin-like protein Pup [Micrococcus terreus]SFV22875.1 prokaryotic ubiquitin-like protein Pup [Micrococcus terreus]
MPQQQSGSSSQREEDLGPGPAPAPGGGAAASQANTADLDSLLDEIDSVLETNAEEFVKGFVQKGGQ